MTSQDKRSIYKLAILLSVLVFILFFSWDYVIVNTFFSFDLRNRIVGSRLLDEGYSPYYFMWNQSMSERLLDPYQPPGCLFTRTTVPPSILMMLIPLSKLHYSTIKVAWFLIEYIILLFMIFVFYRHSNSKKSRDIVLIVGLLFLSASVNWRVHIDRGQTYILYAFMLTLIYLTLKSSLKHREMAAGLLLGMSIWMRPPFAFVLIPFVFAKKQGVLRGVLFFCLAAGFFTVAFGQVPQWIDYYRNAREWDQVDGGKTQLVETNTAYLRFVEGSDDSYSMSIIARRNLSTQYITASYFGINLSMQTLLLLLFMVSAALAFALRTTLSNKEPENLLLTGFLFMIVCEYFMPVPRQSYNLVEWFFPILLVFSDWQKLLKTYAIYPIAAGLFINLGFFYRLVGWDILAAELLFFLGVILFIKNDGLFSKPHMGSRG